MGLSKESPISTDLSLLYSKCTFKTTFHALQKSSKDSFFHLPVQSEENSNTEQCKIPIEGKNAKYDITCCQNQISPTLKPQTVKFQLVITLFDPEIARYSRKKHELDRNRQSL